MKLKINENLLNKMNKRTVYPTLNIKMKEIKLRNKKSIINSSDNSPSAFSFSLDQNNNKIFNIKGKSDFIKSHFNKNTFNLKLIKKYNLLLNKRNEGNIRTILFNKGTSTSDSLDATINKEKMNNAFIKSFNYIKEKNDDLIIHKKIFILNKIDVLKPKNNNMNNRSKNQPKSLTKSASRKKYQTIFTKYNDKKDFKKIEKSQEPHNYEILSSKYSNIKNNEVESKEVQTPRKLFSNEEIKKTKFQFYNMNNDKYLRTDGAINYNLTLSSLMPNYVNLPNTENLQNFEKICKPIFYCQKDSVKQKLNLMMQNKEAYRKIKPNHDQCWNLDNKYKYNHQKILMNKLNKNNRRYYLKNNGIKFISVNLNGVTQIPNRLIKLDRYGNKINNANRNNNSCRRTLNQSDNLKIMKNKMINKFNYINNLLKQE